jgi:hypothetical protein
VGKVLKVWFTSNAVTWRIASAWQKINAKKFWWGTLVTNLGGHFAKVAISLLSTEELATKSISYARSTIIFPQPAPVSHAQKSN